MKILAVEFVGFQGVSSLFFPPYPKAQLHETIILAFIV